MQWISMKAQWLAASLGVALAAQTANAVERDTFSVAVSLKDLDLTSWDGDIVAQKRIVSASKEVCRAADMRDLKANADDQCREAALRDGMLQVHKLEAKARVQSELAAK